MVEILNKLNEAMELVQAKEKAVTIREGKCHHREDILKTEEEFFKKRLSDLQEKENKIIPIADLHAFRKEAESLMAEAKKKTTELKEAEQSFRTVRDNELKKIQIAREDIKAEMDGVLKRQEKIEEEVKTRVNKIIDTIKR